MAIDEAEVGVLAAGLMEELTATYGDDAKIGTVCVIVTVDHGDDDTIHYRMSPGTANHLAIGILTVVSDVLRGKTT